MKTFLISIMLLGSLPLVSFKSPTIREPFMIVFIEHQNASPGKSDGAIQVSVSGGTAPYQMLVVSVPLAETKRFASGEKMEAKGLQAGRYQIHITDQKDLSYFKEITLE